MIDKEQMDSIRDEVRLLYAMIHRLLPILGADYLVVDEVLSELSTIKRRGIKPYNSAHEGYAVIAEELDELWDEVRAKGHLRDYDKMRQECIQIAATAIRFITDVIDKEKPRHLWE